MNIKKWVLEFLIVFIVSLSAVALVTFLWNLLGHGESSVNWKISFPFAFLFSYVVVRLRMRAVWKKQKG